MCKYIFKLRILLVFATIMSSCNEKFLERYPLDAISNEAFWTTDKDLENYVNGLYDILPAYTAYAPKYDWENGSDNIIGDDSGSTILHSNLWRLSGDAPQTSSTWNGLYDNIRKVNFFLEQKDKVGEAILSGVRGKHFVGEAYFFRAWVNYSLLTNYGGVPYIDKVLTTSSKELYTSRMARNEFARKIIDDLDIAVEKLQWKGSGPAAVSMRITKESALAFKIRVALFEGSWEYYHKKAGTPFTVANQDGTAFLNDVIIAGDALIAKLGQSIYMKDYRTLFNQDNYSAIPGVLLYRHYLPSDGIGHRWWNYTGAGGGSIGLTKTLIDDYLMADGTPIELSTSYKGDNLLEDVVNGRDPRLGQTIYHPSLGTVGQITGRGDLFKAPGITTKLSSYRCTTGYFAYKGVAPQDAIYNGNPGGQGFIYMRYEESLLAYAEAKAILGSLSQSDLDKTVNVLRNRVGMANMVMTTVNSWGGNYLKRYMNESNIINEIRRERRVELALEGLRYDDLRRWAVLDKLIGWVPQGAKAQQFLDYANSVDGKAAGYKLVAADIKVDSKGYLLPIGFRSDFLEGGTGFDFKANRDYLNAIPKAQIILYKEKGGVDLIQNPNWN